MEIDPIFAESIFRNTIKKKEFSDKKVLFFYLKDWLDKHLYLLESNFPDSAFHTVAIKTMAEPEVLNHIVRRGFGMEAASFEEVLLAKKAGASNEQIVFDSPVKTREEIDLCHKNYTGITLNSNSIQELNRYPLNFNGKIGLRINPLENSDAPKIFNLSGADSKFGVPINQKEEIIKACKQFSFIKGLHVHIGSGIHDFKNNINAVKKIKTLADEINQIRKNNNEDNLIEYIDIGGGISFDEKIPKYSMKEFVHQLSKIDGLFSNYKIITEYGNFVHRYNGFVVSDIEYIISRAAPEPSLVYIHVGADMFVRKIYSTLPINYPVFAIKKRKSISDPIENYRIVGPLCFEGDILFNHIQLPRLSEEDKIMIMSTGANTISMWSRHCNRNLPEFVFI